MVPLHSNLIIQIFAFTACFAPYLIMAFFGIYRCIQKREKRKQLNLKREAISKGNDFSLRDFEGDNANLAINNNYAPDFSVEYLKASVEAHLKTIDQLYKTIDRLYQDKDRLEAGMERLIEEGDALRNELYEYKYYNSPNIFKLLESHENKHT